MRLEFDHVSGTTKKFNLKDISFSLEEGYLLGIAGKNGAGKTTLFRYMLEWNQSYEGNIYLDGRNIRDNHAAFLDQVSYISEETPYFLTYTALTNAKLLGPFYKNWSLDTFIEKMNQLSLPTGKKLEVMSKGEFFRFQLAFGMAHQARLYLMDEITGGMDVVFRSDFFKLVKAEILEAGASAILITHIEEEIVRQVDFVGIMEAGRLISYQEAWVE